MQVGSVSIEPITMKSGDSSFRQSTTLLHAASVSGNLPGAMSWVLIPVKGPRVPGPGRGRTRTA